MIKELAIDMSALYGLLSGHAASSARQHLTENKTLITIEITGRTDLEGDSLACVSVIACSAFHDFLLGEGSASETEA